MMNRCRQLFVYDFTVFDAGYLIHTLARKATKGETFRKYFEKLFCPRIVHELGCQEDYILCGYVTILCPLKKTRETNGHTAVGNVWRILQKFLGTCKRFWWMLTTKNSFFFLLISLVFYRQDNCRTQKSCTSQKIIVWSIWMKELQWGNATMKSQIPAY